MNDKNMSKYKHAREVIDAIEAGKQIQSWTECDGGYYTDDSEPFRWSLQCLNDPKLVRIKREPRRVWVGFRRDGTPASVWNSSINATSPVGSWDEVAVEFVEVVKS